MTQSVTNFTMDEFIIALYMAMIIMLMRMGWKLLLFIALKIYSRVLKKCCTKRPVETSKDRPPPPTIQADDPTYEVVQPHYYSA